jgi:hypothetical protein
VLGIATDWRAVKRMTLRGRGYSGPPHYKKERAAPFTSYQKPVANPSFRNTGIVVEFSERCRRDPPKSSEARAAVKLSASDQFEMNLISGRCTHLAAWP